MRDLQRCQKTQVFKSAIEQISRRFILADKHMKISNRNSKVLRYPRHFQGIVRGEFIGRFPSGPKGFADSS